MCERTFIHECVHTQTTSIPFACPTYHRHEFFECVIYFRSFLSRSPDFQVFQLHSLFSSMEFCILYYEKLGARHKFQECNSFFSSTFTKIKQFVIYRV